jgi:hypothetical protein
MKRFIQGEHRGQPFERAAEPEKVGAGTGHAAQVLKIQPSGRLLPRRLLV